MIDIRHTDEVRDALHRGAPVVALESTIISHGMPYPQNVETARAVERVVRDAGAVPATIAVLHGVPTVGLDDDALELLGNDRTVLKASVRDLPYVIAAGRHGATTVSATMRLAALAGVRVFATGGTGGVHRGAESTFDVSADLTELARTDVAVVSAGVKSILDIGRTLEVLETLGVPVIVLGARTFPAFYSRDSGFPAPLTLDTPADVAAMLRAKRALGLACGTLVANPIPQDAEIPRAEIDPIIARALTEMDTAGIVGKETTPFLLKRIVEITGGRSLAANVALVKHNARVAAEIAVALAAEGA
ncbi:Pseudouridine-5'-phosphate glycosidase (plasmid) [Gemmatirosa kalamazoonensis]|uniref:Pseudouridine-5'-phosphate glycosidase n=1 Tax=Gemmatirosa kalamazoonensis TaxID=861299 RepID=W0RSA8_9BACT|nr:pseudouridine-5'-phosphate glycosidase [Gemmatirosa kalamazoonensis]AHG93869.1 Pseudouridine-5'-phosphate glycosidase [Gemmatirosa kalamazoonensis]